MESLIGSIDTHVHSAPDVIQRKLDDLELVQQAQVAGMRALVLKSHVGSTCERAYLLNRSFPMFQVLGGITLNDTVGGLNPRAVESALKMGASVVWMPTKSAANHCRHLGGGGQLTVRNGASRLTSDAAAIVRLVADAGAVLATGHLSPEESEILIEHALATGVDRISVTHPEWRVTAIRPEMQLKWAQTGCVYFERCLVSTQTDLFGHVSFGTIVSQIRAVGVSSSVLATDYGMPQFPTPVQGMRDYLARLRENGFTDAEVSAMVRENPARLLKLSADGEQQA